MEEAPAVAVGLAEVEVVVVLAVVAVESVVVEQAAHEAVAALVAQAAAVAEAALGVVVEPGAELHDPERGGVLGEDGVEHLGLDVGAEAAGAACVEGHLGPFIAERDVEVGPVDGRDPPALDVGVERDALDLVGEVVDDDLVVGDEDDLAGAEVGVGLVVETGAEGDAAPCDEAIDVGLEHLVGADAPGHAVGPLAPAHVAADDEAPVDLRALLAGRGVLRAGPVDVGPLGLHDAAAEAVGDVSLEVGLLQIGSPKPGVL